MWRSCGPVVPRDQTFNAQLLLAQLLQPSPTGIQFDFLQGNGQGVSPSLGDPPLLDHLELPLNAHFDALGHVWKFLAGVLLGGKERRGFASHVNQSPLLIHVHHHSGHPLPNFVVQQSLFQKRIELRI
jgi:hypothetical protein